MIDSHSLFLLIAALVSVVGLIVMIAVVKLNPVITLFITALALAIVTGMPLTTLIKSFETGMGGTLGHIAIIVALGTMLGKMMAESGAADRIAYTLVRVFGEKNVPWAMVVIALLVGLPAFFEVGFVLLIPILFTVARKTNTSLVMAGLPMVAGLSVVHGLVPPHPAAMLAVTTYHADVGRTILYGLLIGTPTAIIAGPLYAKLIAPHIKLADVNPMAEQFTSHEDGKHLPGFWLSVATIILAGDADGCGELGRYVCRCGQRAEQRTATDWQRRHGAADRRADELCHAGHDARISASHGAALQQ